MFLERYKDTMIVYNNIMERLRNELMKKIEKDGEQKIIQLGRSAYELARKQNGMMPGAIAEASYLMWKSELVVKRLAFHVTPHM